MDNRPKRVYAGTLYENVKGEHTWIAGSLGAMRVSIWPAKKTTDSGGRMFNLYFEERPQDDNRAPRRDTGTAQIDDKIRF